MLDTVVMQKLHDALHVLRSELDADPTDELQAAVTRLAEAIMWRDADLKLKAQTLGANY